MQPLDEYQADAPTSPITRAGAGMAVVDAAGDEAGTVSAVQAPGTDIRPDTLAGVAEVLMSTGYLRIDGTGALSNDTYASGEQIADITPGDPGTVRLNVRRGELPRATS